MAWIDLMATENFGLFLVGYFIVLLITGVVVRFASYALYDWLRDRRRMNGRER